MTPRHPGVLRWGVTLAAGLLILLLAGILALAEWRDYEQTLETARNRAQNLATLLAVQTETTVLGIDRTLRGISRTVQNNGMGPASRPILTRLATQDARDMAGLRAFLVIDSGGTLIAESENDPPRALNFGDRDFFRRHRDSAADAMSIDIESAVEGAAPSVIFARRINGADGKFAGVAAAQFDPGELGPLYRNATRGGAIALLLAADGTVLAREPPAGTTGFGSHVAIAALASAIDNGAAAVIPGEDLPRLLGLARFQRLPLLLAVGFDRDRALAHWRLDAAIDSCIALLGLSAIVAMLFMLRRYLLHQSEQRRELAERDRALRASNDHLVAALAHTNHGTVMFDGDHRLVLCNPRYLELMRLNEGSVRPGMSFEETIEVLRQQGSYSPIDLVEMAANRRAALAAGGAHTSFEHLADGTILQVRSDPVRDGGLLLTVTDMTAAVASAEALRAAKEEAERASEAKSDFIAHVSHDLRTPLTAIIGFADALSGGYFGPLPPKQKEYIDTIGISAQHLLALINNLLDVAKIEAGRYELEEEEIDLADMVERSLRMVQLRADQQGITIVNRVSEAWLVADANALQQMLLNLLSNAVKFTPSGGTVSIATSPAPEGGLDVTVRDTGVGIPPEYRDQVMLPYVRVTGGRRAEGTGLGLPLAKALIELHGGAILLESELGQGTGVTLRFPAARILSVAAPSAES